MRKSKTKIAAQTLKYGSTRLGWCTIIAKNKRGRRRKHNWIEFLDLEYDSSLEAQYLRWVSVNNTALARCEHDGCPQCAGKSFRLRHDEKFNNIRFYCPNCGFETSFHIIHPKRSLRSIEVYDDKGNLVGIKSIDDSHEKTSRENADSRVMISEQKLDLGGEWFDGVSGTNSQSRYLTREEVLKRIEDRKMKRLMEAALEEIESIEQDERGFRLQS
jgi:ribosomal protein S27AE